MDFRVLGTMEVCGDSGPIDIGPRMPRAVLAVLLISLNQIVSTDRLLEELWGEEQPPAATGALQAYISKLRRALEPARSKGSPPTVLVTQAPGYVLRVEPTDVDACRFEQLVLAGRAHLAAGRPEAGRDALQTALGTWRGMPYADLAFERFVQLEVARLGELRKGAAEAYADAELQLGQHVTAVAELERLVAEDPLRERRWELLALGLYRSGRQAEALRTLADARRRLGEELGIEVGAPLRQLESDILQQERSLDWKPPAVESVREPVGTASGPPKSPSGDGDMVGRDGELALLLRLLDQASSDQGGVALLSGEPGIGKTRLAEELAARAAEQGAYVAWGPAHEGEGAPAFWPWVQVVHALADQLDRDTFRAALGAGAAEVAQIVPDIKDVIGDLDPVTVSTTSRTRLYEALTRFLLRVAAGRPIVLVLDDLHWADAPSVQLFAFLASQLKSVPALVVGTYRDGEVWDGHPLGAVLASLARQPNVHHIALGGLQQEDVARLLTVPAGLPPTEELVEEVLGRTEGNPFFVVELARLIRSEGGRGEVPARARDVIRRRLTILPEESRRLLTVAAVLGRDFDLEVVAEAMQIDLDDLLEHLEAALASRVVTEIPGSVGWYRFSHALVRQTLYENLSALRRARLHQRLAETLEARGGVEPSELAHHYWQAAEVVGGAQAALAWADRAAEQAMSRLAYEQTASLLQRALGLLARLPPGAEHERRELDLQGRLWVVLAMIKGKGAAEVGHAAERAVELGRRLGDVSQLAPALYRLASFHALRGDIGVAAGQTNELLALASTSTDPVIQLLAHAASGYCDLYRGRLISARGHLQSTLALPEALADEALIPTFLQHPGVGISSYTAIILGLMGEADQARELTADALAVARTLGHPFTLTFALHYDTWLATILHDDAYALAQAEQTVDACRKGEFSWVAASGLLLGWARARLGEPVEGLAIMKARLTEWEATGARRYQHCFLALLAEGYLLNARPEEAVRAADAGLESAHRTGEVFYEAELHRLKGEALALIPSEPATSAEMSLRQAATVARQQGAALLERRATDSLAALLRTRATVR